MKRILTISIILVLILTGCSKSTKDETVIPLDEDANDSEPLSKDVLKDIHSEIMNYLGDDYVSTSSMSEIELKELAGINSDVLVDFVAQRPEKSDYIDRFIAVQVKDGSEQEAFDSLNHFRSYHVSQADSSVKPENRAKLKASEVVRHGNYVFFVMMGHFDTNKHSSEEEKIYFAEGETEQIKEIIANHFN